MLDDFFLPAQDDAKSIGVDNSAEEGKTLLPFQRIVTRFLIQTIVANTAAAKAGMDPLSGNIG